jgi:amidase
MEMTKQLTRLLQRTGRVAATTCLLGGLVLSPGLSSGQENASDDPNPSGDVFAAQDEGRAPREPRPPRPPRPPRDPDQTFELGSATIPEIQAAMNSNGLSAVELVSMFLRRQQAYNVTSPVSPPQPLNAILYSNENVLEDAAESDRLRKKGVMLGPLHGIPYLVKGSFSIKDFYITGGHNGWRDMTTPNQSNVITMLQRSGALFMGQANMDTWASSATSSTSQIRGTVRSCYLNGALPGGSSGGSGVSTGAYLTHFAFGGETGGSIRNPGDRSNLVAYKVSGGSITVDKIIPLVPERDVIGPMTRAAIDNAIVRDVVGKKDPEDIWSPILPILEDKRPVPETGFVKALEGATLAGKKIGIIGTYVGMPHPNPSLPGSTTNTTQAQTTTPLVRALVESAKAEMEALGATVEYVFMPPQVSTTYNRGAGAPVTQLLNSPHSTNVGAYSYRELIKTIVAEPGDTYQLLAPKVIARAALVSSISAAVRNAMYTFDSSTGLYSDGPAIPFGSPQGIEHYMARAQQKNAFEDWMDAEGLDAVVWPMWPNKTATGGTIIGRDLVNFMYLPAVTVPIGILQYDDTRYEGLTMNVTGRLFDDANVLAIAYAYEQATHHRYDPPLAPPLEGEVFDWKLRRLKKWAVVDDVPPALSVGKNIKNQKGIVTFHGSVSDKSGIEKVDVSVGGMLLAAEVKGKDWAAVLTPEDSAALLASGVTSIDVLAMATDLAGNMSSAFKDVKIK